MSSRCFRQSRQNVIAVAAVGLMLAASSCAAPKRYAQAPAQSCHRIVNADAAVAAARRATAARRSPVPTAPPKPHFLQVVHVEGSSTPSVEPATLVEPDTAPPSLAEQLFGEPSDSTTPEPEQVAAAIAPVTGSVSTAAAVLSTTDVPTTDVRTTDADTTAAAGIASLADASPVSGSFAWLEQVTPRETVVSVAPETSIPDAAALGVAASAAWSSQTDKTSQPALLAQVLPAGHGSCQNCPPGHTTGTFSQAEPRVALPLTAACPQICPLPWTEPGDVAVAVYEPEIYPEEYICDGGDRDDPVHYSPFGRRGLDTEDTVAEFTDDTGRRHIRPSTRTCIYAPQFAAVRSASLPQIGVAVDRLAGTHDRRGTVGLLAEQATGVQQHNDQPIGLDLRTRASGLDRDMADSSVAKVVAPARHIKLNNVFENELFLAPGGLDRTQEAYLAHIVQVAAAWTRNLNPVIVATDSAGEEVLANFSVEEYVGVEDRSRKGDLKIIKVVDEPTAVPGDVVTFTIHYENIGDRNLYNIQILDNLTPRLELLPDSMESDREGEFTIEDNNEGSIVLTFTLTDPLPGTTSGTLTFQCRVR